MNKLSSKLKEALIAGIDLGGRAGSWIGIQFGKLLRFIYTLICSIISYLRFDLLKFFVDHIENLLILIGSIVAFIGGLIYKFFDSFVRSIKDGFA
ncbi:unnamed protein product [Brachionus calyciflorus]|uniref:Uncharacterized protein n=1 Tax=Brachionus calyciflorus TaxID=104777 RepID=A0A814IUV1_9BILA|nr:unnamed protein product [Brachionus calyciflorus]